MQSTNYISVIPNELRSRIISKSILDKTIEYLKNYVSDEHKIIKWKKDYLDQETFVNGISTTTGKYHLILPRFTYTINVKKAYKKNVVKSIACNTFILVHINDANFDTKEYVEYFSCLIIRRYAYQTYKDHISSDMTLNDLLPDVLEYLSKEISNEDVIEQIKKNSTRKVITEGSSLTTSEKKSISVKQSKKRNQEEIDYILEMNKQGLSSRIISIKFEEKFKKKISYRTVQNVLKQYK